MEYAIPVTTTGANGSASGSNTTEVLVRGLIWAIYIDYHASAPNTTVVTVSETGGAGRTILTAPAANTDAGFRPREVTHTAAGVAQTNYTEPILIEGRKITVAITLSNALAPAATVYIYTVDTKTAM